MYNINFVFHKNNYGNVVIITTFFRVRELPTDSFYFCLLTEEGRLANNVKNISDKEKNGVVKKENGDKVCDKKF